MPQLHVAPLACTLFVLTCLIVAAGCSDHGSASKGNGDAGKGGPPTQSTPPPSGGKTVVEGKGLATIVGTVTYDGTPPAPADITDQVKAQADHSHCLKEVPDNKRATKGEDWVVNAEGKVANVAIWVRPPANKYFNLSADDVKGLAKEPVKVDQPFCHLEPHVSVAFTDYYDGAAKKMVPTKQEIVIDNSAPISHSTKVSSLDRTHISIGATFQAKGPIKIQQRASNTTPLTISCNIHPWMSGYIWVLDTPYAAVTKEDGTYEIKGVPAGAEVMVVVWHEQAGFQEGGSAGKAHTIKDGENKLDFKVKAK